MTPPQVYYCSECGRQTSPEQLARFGDRLVCVNCKDAYAQKLREGVPPVTGFRYGGFWLRLVGIFIDGVILAIPVLILEFVLAAALGMSVTRVGPNPSPDEVFAMLGPLMGLIGLVWLISMAIGATYEGFFLSKFGATPGKMAIGVKVVRPDGSGITIGRAVGRYFARMLSGIILYIGFIMAGFDPQKRALHDRICDTLVVKTRS